MLAVGVKLNNAVIIMPIRILHTSLESAGKTQVCLKIQEWILILTTYPNGIVNRAIINDDVIDLGNNGS